MKNLVFNLAIALIVIAYVSDMSNHSKRTSKNNSAIVLEASKPVFEQGAAGSDKFKNNEGLTSMRIERVMADNNQMSRMYFSNEVKVLSSEAIESMFPNRAERTIEEIVAEDNAITGNNFSNQNASYNVAIDNVAFKNAEKTIEEIIAEDNAITGNNSSDEVESADFTNGNFAIDNVVFNKSGKAIEEIIAEDNAVTGNNSSDEVESADFTNGNFAIDNVVFNKEGKTIEEIIIEDNAITENNFSNETRALAFK